MVGGKALVHIGQAALIDAFHSVVKMLSQIIAKKNAILDLRFARHRGVANEDFSALVGGNRAVEIEIFGKCIGNDHLPAPIAIFLRFT